MSQERRDNRKSPPPTDASAPADAAGPKLTTAVDDALALLREPSGLTVLVNDPQRHTDSAAVLKALSLRVSARQIRVLVAAGSHRFATAQRAGFAGWLSDGLDLEQVEWHDCRSGKLQAVPRAGWRCHPWLLEDRPVLAVGSVEPHYFAGFTGAHKTATIGCAAYEDIEANHAAALLPQARACRLADNPVHQGIVGMLLSLAKLQAVAAVNLVQSGREMLTCAGGGILESLEAVRPIAEGSFVRRLDEPADAVVACVSGPLGVSFYQADKGIKNTEWAVRNGGAIVLCAPCPEGIGQREFFDLLTEAPTYRSATDIVRTRGYRLGDHKAVKLRYTTDPSCRGIRIYIVSDGICPKDAAVLGFVKSASVELALRDAAGHTLCDNVVQVHDAGNTVVVCKEGSV